MTGIPERVDVDLIELRVLIENYYDIQHLRIIAGNRLKAAVDRHGLAPEKAQALEDWMDTRLEIHEGELRKLVGQRVKDHPLWRDWLQGVKGVGPCIAGGLIAWIGDIGRFDTVSKLWAYSGLGLKDGEIQRRKREEKANWNPRLKALAWKAAESFVRLGKGYRTLYEQEKVRLRRLHPEALSYDPPRFTKRREGQEQREVMNYSDGHIDNMARRKVAKLFLSHVWQRWREIDGLPIRLPYVVEHLGHTSVIPVVEE